jgi:hypothetical protein
MVGHRAAAERIYSRVVEIASVNSVSELFERMWSCKFVDFWLDEKLCPLNWFFVTVRRGEAEGQWGRRSDLPGGMTGSFPADDVDVTPENGVWRHISRRSERGDRRWIASIYRHALL